MARVFLSACEFVVSSYELRFVVYSDLPCRAEHLRCIEFATPGSGERLEFYRICPSPGSRWVVVEETWDFNKTRRRYFIRSGAELTERAPGTVGATVLHQLAEKLTHQCQKTHRSAKPATTAA